MNKICIIPARGKSKRIRRKNIRLFADKPIIAHSIDVAKKSNLFDRIIVSTDDSEIAEIAKKYGAEIPFIRPDELSDDHTGTVPVVGHALKCLIESGYEVNVACCLYATAPLVQIEYLKLGYTKLMSSSADYCFSIARLPISTQKSLMLNESGYTKPMFPSEYRGRSQDKTEAFYDAGQFYWGHVEAFTDDIPVATASSIGVVIPNKFVQDIDTEEDFELAELLYNSHRIIKLSK